jgi:hypothetical protein
MQYVTPEDGHDERPKHVEFLEIKAKIPLHLVGCIYTYRNTMHGTMNLKFLVMFWDDLLQIA